MKNKLLLIALMVTFLIKPFAFSAPGRAEIVKTTTKEGAPLTKESKEAVALESLKREIKESDLREAEAKELVVSLAGTGTRALGLGKVYLKASPEGRIELKKLLAQTRDNNVNLTLVFIEKLGGSENLSGERLALFNQLVLISSKLPEFLKGNDPISKETREELKNNATAPKTYREFLDTVISRMQVAKEGEAGTLGGPRDVLDVIKEILPPELLAKLLSCRA